MPKTSTTATTVTSTPDAPVNDAPDAVLALAESMTPEQKAMVRDAIAQEMAATTPDAPVNDVPETRVTIPVEASRPLPPALSGLAATQHDITNMPRMRDVVQAAAETFYASVDAIEALVYLSRDTLATLAESDATICGSERVQQCLTSIREYRDSAGDSDAQALLLDRINLQFAAIAPWVRATGKTVVNAITGEAHARSDDEIAALKMGKRVAALATRMVPQHLTQAQKDKVATFRQQKADKRAQRASGVTGPVVNSTLAIEGK